MHRVGTGWDRHPLSPGRPCILGGVHFADCPVGPVGHSDGDAVCHAVIDALLGAAGLGDIGHHFPDTAAEWAGADSLDLLARTAVMIGEAGYRIGNVDCTVIAEQPRIATRARQMSEKMAGALAISSALVSVKATRGEGLGPEGRGECLSVMAIALLEGGRGI